MYQSLDPLSLVNKLILVYRVICFHESTIQFKEQVPPLVPEELDLLATSYLSLETNQSIENN